MDPILAARSTPATEAGAEAIQDLVRGRREAAMASNCRRASSWRVRKASGDSASTSEMTSRRDTSKKDAGWVRADARDCAAAT